MLYIYVYVFEKSNPIIPNSYHAYISHRRTSVKLFESKYLFDFKYDIRLDLELTCWKSSKIYRPITFLEVKGFLS